MYAIEYRIYIGRNIKDQPMSEEKFTEVINLLERELANVPVDDNGNTVSGTTTFRTIGQWKGSYEQSAVISTIVLGPYNSRIDSSIRNVVRKVKRIAQQESILLLRNTVDVEFV